MALARNRAVPAAGGFYPIMAERDASMLEGLHLRRSAQSVDEADFILNTGVESANDRVEDFEDALREAASRHLPMVCANPDLVVMHRGKMEICAGSIAQRYEELRRQGALLRQAPCADLSRMLCPAEASTDRSRILAVGDSLRTDIAGANAAGIDGLLGAGRHPPGRAGGRRSRGRRSRAQGSDPGRRGARISLVGCIRCITMRMRWAREPSCGQRPMRTRKLDLAFRPAGEPRSGRCWPIPPASTRRPNCRATQIEETPQPDGSVRYIGRATQGPVQAGMAGKAGQLGLRPVVRALPLFHPGPAGLLCARLEAGAGGHGLPHRL